MKSTIKYGVLALLLPGGAGVWAADPVVKYDITTTVVGGSCTLNLQDFGLHDVGDIINNDSHPRVNDMAVSITDCPQVGMKLPVGVDYVESDDRDDYTTEYAHFMQNTGDAYGYGFILQDATTGQNVSSGGVFAAVTDMQGNAVVHPRVVFKYIPNSGNPLPGSVISSVTLTLLTN